MNGAKTVVITQTNRSGARFWAAGAALVTAATVVVGGCGGNSSGKYARPAENTSTRANPLSAMYRLTVNVTRNSATPKKAYDCWIASKPGQRVEDVDYISNEEFPANIAGAVPGGVNKGMLLFYPNNDTHFISGKNTLIDVDVVFAEGFNPTNANGTPVKNDDGSLVILGRVVNTEHIFPFQRTLVGSDKPVQLILFIRSADNAADPIQPGDIIFPNSEVPPS